MEQNKTKIAIYGYGNLGRGVEFAAAQNSDIELVAVFSRRNPDTVKTSGVKVYPSAEIDAHIGEFDILIICGGSATDLPIMTPELAKKCNVIDSFDTHASIPSHFANVDKSAIENSHIALISGGWDPGLFSLARVYSSAILPDGKSETFWGKGVSQGHSDAIRRIDGVLDARQYTVPVESALEAVRNGDRRDLTAREKHTRECYVVAKEGADKAKIENEIKTMPNYFADYNTTVTFITAEEMAEKHSKLPHGGFVIRNGSTGRDGADNQTIELSLKLDSNPEFTGSVLVALARALNRMSKRGITGCKTVFDIAPADLSPLSPEELRKAML